MQSRSSKGWVNENIQPRLLCPELLLLVPNTFESWNKGDCGLMSAFCPCDIMAEENSPKEERLIGPGVMVAFNSSLRRQ